MNSKKLKDAEAGFLARYPGGFADPGIEPIKKKHNVEKLVEFTQQSLTRESFNRPEFIAETLVKIVSRSSMVSRFEKPKFRDFVRSLNSHEKQALADSFEKRLYGRQKQRGFEEILGFLSHHRIAKWAIISAVPFYFSPRKEAFIKPTTTKGILSYLEVTDLEYKATPSWAFYKGYLSLLADIKKQVAPSLSPNNAALTGFLMSSI
ncbi:MAG TPA: hypothetical protein ENH48_10670 [Halieaceae bacterium]|nr:MAG: hypothetical protein DRQ98_10665 [Gammaproteobacteria bacterium]HDY83399.1 hypothetical protein [Halieaceae bacterium]